MTQENGHYPVVLCFSGHDPTSGAGIAADIEALRAIKCHPSTVVTALTVQDTLNVHRFIPVAAEMVRAQARAIFADLPVAALKIGMVGSCENAAVLGALLRDYPRLPVVLDPIIHAGGGAQLADRDLILSIIEFLLPATTIATPNSNEARALAAADNLDDCARLILAYGCQYVLITGGDEPSAAVVNSLYHAAFPPEIHSWPRLAQTYHGSGCTLAAALAGFLAQGLNPRTAVNAAQEFTWQALAHGYRVGKGQFIPNRCSRPIPELA